MANAPRLFADDEAVRHVGRGLLERTLPKAEWTHEAHLAAFMWLMLERPDIDLARRVREIISGYNEATGGVNSDSAGYHDTITHCYLIGIRGHVDRQSSSPLVDQVNALLLSPEGQRDWPLRFYSRELLFSATARRDFVPPDVAPIEPTLSREHWVAAGTALAENAFALVTCPECREGILRSHDLRLDETHVRRFITCDACSAQSSIKVRAP